MYKAINGIYENGQVFFEETPPTTQKTKVVVMFITDETPQKIRLGSLAGQGFGLPDDFDEPLEDLKDYM